MRLTRRDPMILTEQGVRKVREFFKVSFFPQKKIMELTSKLECVEEQLEQIKMVEKGVPNPTIDKLESLAKAQMRFIQERGLEIDFEESLSEDLFEEYFIF